MNAFIIEEYGSTENSSSTFDTELDSTTRTNASVSNVDTNDYDASSDITSLCSSSDGTAARYPTVREMDLSTVSRINVMPTHVVTTYTLPTYTLPTYVMPTEIKQEPIVESAQKTKWWRWFVCCK
jgi:hypothetical protein